MATIIIMKQTHKKYLKKQPSIKLNQDSLLYRSKPQSQKNLREVKVVKKIIMIHKYHKLIMRQKRKEEAAERKKMILRI